MPLRQRLALYGTGVAAAGVLLFIAVLSGLGGSGVRDDQDRALGVMADAAAASLQSGAATSTARPLVVIDLAASTEPFLLVLSLDGAVRYSSGLLNGAPPRVPAAVVVEANEQGRSVATVAAPGVASRDADAPALRLAARKWASASDGGIVVAGQTTAFPGNQLAGLRAFLVIAAIVTLIVVAIVSWLVAGRAVRPLVTLAKTTEAIGTTGDLSQRLALSQSHDEVGRLTTSFNAMVARLQTSQADLAAALAAQQRFVADASHELRTPLSTIRTNAEFLRERPEASPEDRNAAVADVVSEAERMSRLVDGLLMLARADAGVPMEERRPVDLRAVATEEARRFLAPGRTRDAPHSVAVSAEGSALVSGDADALGRAIRILLENAFQHGSPPVAIAILREDDRISVEVRDSGPGLPKGTEERVFERFYRADPARSGEGTGLGLSIARAIAQTHGGTIRASTAEGGGAAVTIDLPAL